MQKICSECKELKETSYFSKNKVMLDGLQNTCKLCQKLADSKKGKVSKEYAEDFIKDLVSNNKTFTCSCCFKEKTADSFYFQRVHGNVKVNISKCKLCQSEYQATKTFGIDNVSYDALLNKQNNKCAICGIDHNIYKNTSHRNKRFAIDHCHSTGIIRGLLCCKCNRGLGYFKDSEENLLKAAKYLKGNDMI